LEALYRAYQGDRRVSIIAVSIDSVDQIERVKSLAARLSYPVLIDSQGALQKKLISGEVSVPKTFIIDSAFHVLLDDGFVTNQSSDGFVKEKQELITRALVGAFTDHMPPIEHENPGVPLEQAVQPSEGANLYFEAMDEKKLEALAPELRKLFLSARPHASPAEIDRLVEEAKNQIRAGKPVHIIPEKKEQ